MRPRIIWPLVTSTLIALNLLAWFGVAWAYHLNPFAAQHSALLLRVGALNGELLGAGEWWRIITSQFLHVYFLHLLFNMASLLVLGTFLEREYGPLRFASIYLLSGSIGQLAGVIAAPQLVTSGASQAVMGLAGATAFDMLRRRDFGRLQFVGLLIVIIITMTLDIMAVGRPKTGHLAGLCAGAVFGWGLKSRLEKSSV